MQGTAAVRAGHQSKGDASPRLAERSKTHSEGVDHSGPPWTKYERTQKSQDAFGFAVGKSLDNNSFCRGGAKLVEPCNVSAETEGLANELSCYESGH